MKKIGNVFLFYSRIKFIICYLFVGIVIVIPHLNKSFAYLLGPGLPYANMYFKYT